MVYWEQLGIATAEVDTGSWVPIGAGSLYLALLNHDMTYAYASNINARLVSTFWTPTYQGATLKRVRLLATAWRKNGAAEGRFYIKVGDTRYNTTSSASVWGYWDTSIPLGDHALYEMYELETNIATGLPWTIADVNALQAGFWCDDSGVPSGVATDWFWAIAVWEDGIVRTDTITNFTGATCTLRGTIVNSEGFHLHSHHDNFSTGIYGPYYLAVRFNYGETTAYGTNTDWQYDLSEGTQFTADITGLDPAKVYHYRTEMWFNSSPVDRYFYGDDVVISELDPVIRVTTIIHRYVRDGQIYTMECTLGDTTSDFGIPDWLERPTYAITPAGDVPVTAADLRKATSSLWSMLTTRNTTVPMIGSPGYLNYMLGLNKPPTTSFNIKTPADLAAQLEKQGTTSIPMIGSTNYLSYMLGLNKPATTTPTTTTTKKWWEFWK